MKIVFYNGHITVRFIESGQHSYIADNIHKSQTNLLLRQKIKQRFIKNYSLIFVITFNQKLNTIVKI